MHVPTGWHDRIVIEDGKVTRIFQAEWKDYKHGGKMYYCDVYKEDEDSNFYQQNIYRCMYYGRCVAFPGLVINPRPTWYGLGDHSIAVEEGWQKVERRGDYGGQDLKDADKELICSVHPSFKYVFKKYKIIKRWHCMEILAMWKKHPELERILAVGYEKIGMNNNFWKLKEQNRKAVCLFMRQNPQYKEFSLRQVQRCLRSGSPALYAEYMVETEKSWNYADITFTDFLYLKKLKGFSKDSFDSVIARKISIYSDVLRILRNSTHDVNDPYWRHPKDLIAIHDRLVEEERIKREAEGRASRAKFEKYIKIIEKKLSGYEGNIDGYSIFVTSDYSEWMKQADALHQCICAAGYYQMMGRGDCTIVFIQKDGVPQATAQIMPSGKIHQFYADERDRDNCRPSEEIRAAFNKWLEVIPKSKFKKSKPRQRKSEKKEVAA